MRSAEFGIKLRKRVKIVQFLSSLFAFANREGERSWIGELMYKIYFGRKLFVNTCSGGMVVDCPLYTLLMRFFVSKQLHFKNSRFIIRVSKITGEKQNGKQIRNNNTIRQNIF